MGSWHTQEHSPSPWQKLLGSPGLDLNPGTVLGDAVTELTWNTQGVGCPCYSLALWLQSEAPGEEEKRTLVETAASQAQQQVRKAGTSFHAPPTPSQPSFRSAATTVLSGLLGSTHS